MMMDRPKPKLHFRHHEFLDSTTYRACCDVVDVCVNRDLLKAITEEKQLKDNGLLVRFHWDTTESYPSPLLSTITLYQGEKDDKTVFNRQYAVTLARSNFILHEFASEMMHVYKAKLVAVQYPHLAMTFLHDQVFETSIFTSNKLQLYTTLKGLVNQCSPSTKPIQFSLKIDKGSRVSLPHFTPCRCLVTPSGTSTSSVGLEAKNMRDYGSQIDLAIESRRDRGTGKDIYKTVCQNIDAKFVKMECELTHQKESIQHHFKEQKQQAEEIKSILFSLQKSLERENLPKKLPLQINGETERLSQDGESLNAFDTSLASRKPEFSGQNSAIIKRDAARKKKEVHWDRVGEDFQEDTERKRPTVNEITRPKVTTLPQNIRKSRSQYSAQSSSQSMKVYSPQVAPNSPGSPSVRQSGEDIPVLNTRTPVGGQYSPYSQVTNPYGQVVTEDGYTYQVSPQELAYNQTEPDYSDLQTYALNFPITIPFYQYDTMRLVKQRLSDESDGKERFDILVDSIIADDTNRTKLRQKVNEALAEVKKSSLPNVETVTDTVICLDNSERMRGEPLEQMKSKAMDFINAIEDIAEQHELEENIGLVVLGGEPRILHCLSNDYGSLRDALEEVDAEGSSHLLEALLLHLACSTKGGQLLMGEQIKLPPRLILLTDGQGVGDREEHTRVCNAFKQFHRRQPHDYLQGDVLVIPFGQADMTFLREIAQACGGKMIDKSNLRNLARHQRMHKMSSYSLDLFRQNYSSGKSSKLALEMHPDMQDQDRDDIQRILKEHVEEAPMNYATVHRFDNLLVVDNLPPLGSRVVRGIDWKWKNQDTEGAGTIFNHGFDGGWMFVVWDNGTFNAFRYGRENCYDVQLTDLPKQPGVQPMFYTGLLVERGPDWNVTYRNQDGGPGSRGVIIRERHDIGRVMVRWENGGMFEYRFGENNMFDISLIDPIASLVRDADGC